MPWHFRGVADAVLDPCVLGELLGVAQREVS